MAVVAAFLDVSAQRGQTGFALRVHRTGIRDAAGHAEAVAQLGCPFAAFAGTEYGDLCGHQRTLRVTMVMTASRMPTIQKRAVILLSGMPPFW